MDNNDKYTVPGWLQRVLDSLERTNREVSLYWLGLATVCITILAIVSDPKKSDQRFVKFLFLEQIPEDTFFVLSTLIASVLAIAFSSVNAQLFITRGQFENEFKSKLEDKINSGSLSYRDMLNSLVSSSFHRVFPLAQLVSFGRRRSISSSIPNWRRRVGRTAHLIFKCFSISVMYVFPFFALFLGTSKTLFTDEAKSYLFIRVFVGILAFFSMISLLINLFVDCYYLKSSHRIFRRRQ